MDVISSAANIAHLVVQWLTHFCACPWYHWDIEGARDVLVIDQEARAHIISIASLLDHFVH